MRGSVNGQGGRKEEAVDLWLLAKTLKKKGISNSTIERILWLNKNSK
jgi:hypothetical protein